MNESLLVGGLAFVAGMGLYSVTKALLMNMGRQPVPMVRMNGRPTNVMPAPLPPGMQALEPPAPWPPPPPAKKVTQKQPLPDATVPPPRKVTVE